MPSPIVVEDGTGVENANSYVTGDQVRAYAAMRGFTLTPNGDNDFAGDILLLPFVVAATDYLETMSFVGREANPPQGLKWPRECVRFSNGWAGWTELPSTQLPTQLLKAQMQLVVEQLRGISLNASNGGAQQIADNYASPLVGGTAIEAVDGRFIKRERLEGVTDIEYSETVGTGSLPYLPNINKMLALILTDGGNLQLRVGRG